MLVNRLELNPNSGRMSMITEQVFVEWLMGAINTCIQKINESDKWDNVGRGIIETNGSSISLKKTISL